MMEKEENLEHVLDVENQHEAVALARALCPFAEAATDEQMLICVAVVEAKGDDKRVAGILGCKYAAIRRHLQSPLSQRILTELAKHRLKGLAYLKAICALEEVAGSTSQSGNSRRQASESIIKLADESKLVDENKKGDGIDLNTMTLRQLEAFVSTIKQELVKIPVQVIEHEPQQSCIEQDGVGVGVEPSR